MQTVQHRRRELVHVNVTHWVTQQQTLGRLHAVHQDPIQERKTEIAPRRIASEHDLVIFQSNHLVQEIYYVEIGLGHRFHDLRVF